MNIPIKEFFLLMSAVWAFSATRAQTITDVAAPAITLAGTNEVALGSITSEHIKLISFVFKNPGSVPVEITDTVSTCPCIRAFPKKSLIPPTGEQTITVELNPRLVKKTFRRVVWVNTTAATKEQQRIPLYVNGTVVPLFDGLPSETLSFRLNETNEIWKTNLTLTATSTNLFLTTPVVQSDERVLVTASLTTNLTEKASYDLEISATSLGVGRMMTTIKIPIAGRADFSPLEVHLSGRLGSELVIVPDAFLLSPAQKTITRSFTVRTMDANADPALVTFSPQYDGVTIETAVPASKTQRNKSNLLVKITATPEGMQNILTEKDPKITVSYPKHKSAEISFTAR